MDDWLGTGTVAPRLRQYRPFKKARAFVRGLGLESVAEWWDYCQSGRKPADIPASPRRAYANDGWAGYGDWLGTGTVPTNLRQYRSFKRARAFVRGLGLKSQSQWRDYSMSRKKPDDIPSNPHIMYADSGWDSWGDWLGTSSRRGGWRSYKEARAFARGLGLKSQSQWRDYSKSGKKPDDIPAKPDNTYAKAGWAGISDWLGY